VQKSANPVFASHLQGKNTFALLTDFYTPAAIVSSATAWKADLYRVWIKKRLSKKPKNVFARSEATKQSADFMHTTSRLLRFARNDMYLFGQPLSSNYFSNMSFFVFRNPSA